MGAGAQCVSRSCALERCLSVPIFFLKKKKVLRMVLWVQSAVNESQKDY
jgi:hypothetical protein